MATKLRKLRITRVDRVWAPANGTEADGPLARIVLAKAKDMMPVDHSTHSDMAPGDTCPMCGYTKPAKAATKTDGGKQYPAGDYAYVPDPASPSTWKLRLTATPGGPPDPGIVGAAMAALGPGGFRGQKVQIPPAAMGGVKAKVRAAWQKAHPGEDVPPVLKSTGGDMPTETEQLEQLRKAIDEAVAAATEPLQAEVTQLQEGKAEFEAAVEAAKDPDAIDKAALPEPVRKRLEEAEAIAKAAEAAVAKMRDDAEAARWLEVAKGLPFVAVSKAVGGNAAEETGALLHGIAKAAGEESATQLLGVLEAAQAKLAQSELLKAAGKDGTGAVGDAEAQLTKAAEDIRKAAPNLTAAQAYAQAVAGNPKLALEAQEEMARA